MKTEQMFSIGVIFGQLVSKYSEYLTLGAHPDFLSCLAEILRENNVEMKYFQQTRTLVLRRCREFFLDKDLIRQCRILSMKKFDRGADHITAKKEAMQEMRIPEFFHADVVAAMFPEYGACRKPKLVGWATENRGIHLVVNNKNKPDWKRRAANDRD